MNNIKKFAEIKPTKINSLFGYSYYFMNQLKSENLLYIENFAIRDKVTKIEICDFIGICFSHEYLEKRKNNICKSLGFKSEYFEYTFK